MIHKFLLWIDKHIIRLYWNTLRLNRINKDEWAGLKKNRWWNKGTSLVAVITTKCNLHCTDYCPMFLTDNKYPQFEVCTLDEWKKFFADFPEWIAQVYISGGEPSLVPYLSELVNWLIERGHHVIVFSNLKNPEAFYGIKNHWRFVLVPTFHQNYDKPGRYADAYNKLSGRFRIISQEMQSNHKFTFSKHKNFFSEEWFIEENKLYHVAPDAPRTGKIYLGCNKLYIDGKVGK